MSRSGIEEAILLHRSPLRETSLLLGWLTRGAGRIKTALRGARKPGPGAFAAPDLFERHEIVFARSRTSEIHTLKEHRLAAANEGIRENYLRFALAGYFTRLIEAATEPEHPVPDLFDLLDRALAHLSDRPAELARLPAHFERRLASLLGVLGGNDTRDGAQALRAAGVHLPRHREQLIASLRAAE